MHLQFLAVVFGLNLCAVTAFKNGQVADACLSMTPRHGINSINSSTLDPPYTVTSNVSNYIDGQVITVTLQANETGFKGFLLQARDEIGLVGTFTVMGGNAQLLNCGSEGSAVSHTTNEEKLTIMAQWKAPDSGNRDIRFRATFVQNFTVFWVGVQTDPIRFLATNPPNATVLPTNETTSLTNPTVLPTNETTSLTNPTVLPTNATIIPTNTTVLPPRTTTPDNSSPSVSITVCLLLLPLLATI